MIDAEISLDEIKPKKHLCLVTEIKDHKLYGKYGVKKGVLYRMGSEAFKDERRFPKESNRLKVGQRVHFNIVNAQLLYGINGVLINDDRLTKDE